MITEETIPYTADEIKAMEKTCLKYYKALERAQQFSEHPLQEDSADIVEYIFPELVESEDERIKKEILNVFKQLDEGTTICGRNYDYAKWIAWLEKQGKPTHVELGHSEVTKTSDQELEPKFKVGDWVSFPMGIVGRIDTLDDVNYQVTTTDGYNFDYKISKQRFYHLWSINDAKDGDVLVCPYPKSQGGQIFIFKSINNRDYEDNCIEYYCRICKGVFYENTTGYMGTTSSPLHPATKEQRDLLFQKMADAGYQWDSERKELKKMGVTSKEIDDAYLQGICDAKHEIEKQSKKLNADKVIAWLVANICDFEYYVKLFKKDFGL